MVTEQNAGLSVVFQHDEYTAVHHQVYIRTQDIHNLQSALGHNATGHIHKKSILDEHGVQRIESVFSRTGLFAVITGHQVRILLRRFTQRADDHSLGQGHRRLYLAVKGIVHHKVERGAQIGNIALEHFIRIDRNVQTIQVHSVIGCKGCRYIGVLVALHLLRGKSLLKKILKRLFAQSIQNRSTMAVDHRAALAEQIDILLFAIHSFFVF